MKLPWPSHMPKPLDLTKAFDELSHAKFLSKMRSYGILNKELEWFKDYLFDRTQYVQSGTSLSDTGKVRSGVPQESIIGPLLFTLFYNDLPSSLKHSAEFRKKSSLPPAVTVLLTTFLIMQP